MVTSYDYLLSNKTFEYFLSIIYKYSRKGIFDVLTHWSILYSVYETITFTRSIIHLFTILILYGYHDRTHIVTQTCASTLPVTVTFHSPYSSGVHGGPSVSVGPSSSGEGWHFGLEKFRGLE